jgi:DNA-binding LacI/PurR family transcriptional regulator
MAGITKACEASGTGISLVSAATEDLLNWNMSNALVDGFILFCLGGAERLIARSRERFLPFVALAFSDTADVPAIDVDNVAGGRIAAEHLVGLGHTRFGILAIEFNEGSSGPWSLKDMATAALPSARDRIVGSFEVLAAAGTDVATIPVFECLEEAGTVHMALEALFSAAAPPTALIAQSDAIAMIALDWLTAHGLSVPQDVSIIGFDGVPEAALSSPPLTTVAQPIAEIARRAVAAILDRSEETESVLFDPELIVRASTAPPPGR